MAQQFALGSPRAYQPSQAEDTILANMLGKLNGNDASRLGSMLLGNYQQERMNAENVYDDQVARQNAFAYQQLAQKMADDRMKNAVTLFGHPGGAEVIAGTPSLAYSLGQDISAPALTDAASVLRSGQVANAIKAAGQGAYGLVEAGLPPSASGIGSVIPDAGVTQGTPLQLQVTAMKENAANARAAAGRAADMDKMTYSLPLGTDPVTGASLGTVSIPGSSKTGGIGGVIRRRDEASAALTPGGGTYQGGGPTSPTTSAPPAGAGPGMGGAAPGATVTANSGNAYDVKTPAGQQAQANARAIISQLQQRNDQGSKAALADITGNMGGGSIIPLRPGSDGRPRIVGKSGNLYGSQ